VAVGSPKRDVSLVSYSTVYFQFKVCIASVLYHTCLSRERSLFVVPVEELSTLERNPFIEALDVLPSRAGLRGGGCELSAFGQIAVWCISRTEKSVQNVSGLSLDGRTTAILNKVVRSQGINCRHSFYPYSAGQRSPSPSTT
jgi:hypothetical protein